MKPILFILVIPVLLSACNKENIISSKNDIPGATVIYKIPRGGHYSQFNPYVPIETSELNFVVRFDSSAVYQTADPENQLDINKLYGFSDNGGDHHQFSARFGWRWSDGALRLFGYVYNSGEVTWEELATVPIGDDIPCSLKVTVGSYIFSANGRDLQLPRSSLTARASGYRLYPYFGGDEPAPHDVIIRITDQ